MLPAKRRWLGDDERMRRDKLIGSAVLWLVIFIAACGGQPSPRGAAPTPTAGDMSAVQAALALRGVTIQDVVSGDAGCPAQPGLHSNAARFDIVLAGDSQPYQFYLFRWRRPSDFEAAAQHFTDCVDDFAASVTGDVPVDDLEVAPWRAYGPGWSEDLAVTLEQALRDVGGG